jgi:hypothetical protein
MIRSKIIVSGNISGSTCNFIFYLITVGPQTEHSSVFTLKRSELLSFYDFEVTINQIFVPEMIHRFSCRWGTNEKLVCIQRGTSSAT